MTGSNMFEHIWIQCPTEKHHSHTAAVCKQGLRGQIGDYFSGLAQKKKHTWARRANTITSVIFMQQLQCATSSQT